MTLYLDVDDAGLCAEELADVIQDEFEIDLPGHTFVSADEDWCAVRDVKSVEVTVGDEV